LFSKRLTRFTCAALLAAAISATGAAAASATVITGAGSTLVAPLVYEVATAFHKKDKSDSVQYSQSSSGKGITDVTSNATDFGASDAPMTSSEAGACSGCVTIPWALSGVAVGIHINNLPDIKLTGPVIADIYLGSITHWNAPQIKALNHGVNLPNLKITPVYRLDASGDTYAFTDFLSRVSGTWHSKEGPAGTLVNFQHGDGGQGNTAMVSILKSTNGAIAYVAASYLIEESYTHVALVKNNAGKYIAPQEPAIKAAGATVHGASSNGYHIVNPPASAKGAYPISTFTYIITHTNTPKGTAMKAWINYFITTGQSSFGPRLDFAPMPSVVINGAKHQINEIH
jgi:phosphate transport system substrate-binding protein